MNSVKTVPAPPGAPPGALMRMGMTDGLFSLSNAIMMDERCFVMRDGNFIQKYNDYGKNIR